MHDFEPSLIDKIASGFLAILILLCFAGAIATTVGYFAAVGVLPFMMAALAGILCLIMFVV